jgi:hypothetical protein
MVRCRIKSIRQQWGDAMNSAFRYRVMVSPAQQDRQVVRLYLTPVSGEVAKEFLAFEYVYSRHS